MWYSIYGACMVLRMNLHIRICFNIAIIYVIVFVFPVVWYLL